MSDDEDGDDEPADGAGESADERDGADEGNGADERDGADEGNGADERATGPPGDDGETTESNPEADDAAGHPGNDRGSRDEPAADGASAESFAEGEGERDAADADPLAADDEPARTSERSGEEATLHEEADAGETSDGEATGVAVEDAADVDPADEATARTRVDPEDVERAIQEKERERAPATEETAATTASTDSTAGGTEATAERTDGEADAPGVSRAGASDGGAPQRSVSVAIVTVSRDRTHDDDPAGEAIEAALAEHDHEVVTRELLRPTYDTVQQSLDALVGRGDVDAVITNGATGVTQDDVTVEALHPIIEKALPGFGEVFRSRYYEAVGTDVVASRATAGIADGTPIFCLPGDPTAVRLGVDEIVAEQAPRIVDAIEAEGPADD